VKHWLFDRFEHRIDPFAASAETMPPDTVARFYAYNLRQVWRSFAVLLVLGLVGALIEVALFDFLGRIVDWVQSSEPQAFFARHGSELLMMAVIALLLRPLMFGLHDLVMHQTIAPSLTTRVRWQNHRYLLRQSLSFFQNDFAGRIANRVMQTGSALRESAVQTVDAIWYVIIYAGSAVFLFAQADWRLALPLLLWIAGYTWAMCYFVPRIGDRSTIAAEATSKLMGRIVDGYTNIATLKLFAHTHLEERYVRAALQEQTEKSRLSGRVVVAMDFTVTVLNGFLIVGTGGLALWLWSGGHVSSGAIALSIGLCIRISNMSGWIMWVISGIFENIGTVRDGMSTICVPQSVTDREAAPALTVSRGEIAFDDLHFHYGRAGGVIAGLQLRVGAGEKIGLVGPSGAGKSTLVNLLLRLYDVEAGSILIDGQNIAAVTQESLRSQIGMVTQDTSLLHRSIRDNLLYGAPDASEEALRTAIRRARADEFIDTLEDGEGRRGLDAHVGERGVKLSGGQRQRIAIARVLLKDAPILILDEATSALDSEVEAVIQQSLDVLMEGKTVIAIAHRLSTIARMDRLVVLEQGRIVESGKHAELVNANGLYARLWQRQTGGFVGV
jgi:ATP-binding cassette subfamily B multidrug efflux pump